jgi:hypothetical protein
LLVRQQAPSRSSIYGRKQIWSLDERRADHINASSNDLVGKVLDPYEMPMQLI